MPHLLHSFNSSARTTEVNSLRPQICFITFLWPVLPLFFWSVQNWAQEHMLSSTRATAKIVFFLSFVVLKRHAFLTGACLGVTVDCKLCDLWHFGGHCKIDLQVLNISLRTPQLVAANTRAGPSSRFVYVLWAVVFTHLQPLCHLFQKLPH